MNIIVIVIVSTIIIVISILISEGMAQDLPILIGEPFVITAAGSGEKAAWEQQLGPKKRESSFRVPWVPKKVPFKGVYKGDYKRIYSRVL